ncbi:MAG: B12-binding domain-containing radical SAM protein [Leptospiraceae bacterium]|nr:B12-binding domain-containing radical SAM protein [Leptospiraceae bacterium]
MKTLFIQNNGIQESIGVANLSGILKANGHQCDLLLVSHTPDLMSAIEKENPDLIALSALTGIHQSLLLLAKEIKSNFNIPILMGGPHPTYSPEVIENPAVDIICRGEGELAILELADKMEADQDITKIQNLYVKDKKGIIHKNDIRPPVTLDELPFPDRELYYKYSFIRNVSMKRFIASMGCPYPCTFCHEPVIREIYKGKGQYVRQKSVSRIVAEIKYIKERYPLKHVHFSDDLFFIRNSYEWLEEFAEIYPKEIGLPFNANIRYDSINEHAADLLKKAGAYGMAIGLESGNEQLRQVVIRKMSKNSLIVQGARLLRERKIKMLTTNMIGLPGETIDQAFETVELNMKLKSTYTRANTFLLFPGLPLVDYARREGFVEPNFDIEKHIAESLEINLKTPYRKEFENLCCLFWVFVHFDPKWIPLFKKIVKLPNNFFFRVIGSFNMVQELLFYRIRLISGIRFFKNTILASRGIMTMRNIPSLFKRKKSSLTTSQVVHEVDRGLL